MANINFLNVMNKLAFTSKNSNITIQLDNNDKSNVYCVPSGNFGNITAGLLAKKMGLPIDKIIGATNSNDAVPNFFKNNIYKSKLSISTISNAMDVGDPSNLIRIMDIYKYVENLKNDMNCWSFNDNSTKQCIIETMNSKQYLLDPHSAIGLLGLQKYMKEISFNINAIFLGTAHPGKFADIIEPIIKKHVIIPETLSNVIKKEKKSKFMNNDYKEFYDYLIQTFQ